VSTIYLFPSPCESFYNSRPQLRLELYGCCHAVGSPLTQNHIVSLFSISSSSSTSNSSPPLLALPCLRHHPIPSRHRIVSTNSLSTSNTDLLHRHTHQSPIFTTTHPLLCPSPKPADAFLDHHLSLASDSCAFTKAAVFRPTALATCTVMPSAAQSFSKAGLQSR
jgi:hypothetical protein